MRTIIFPENPEFGRVGLGILRIRQSKDFFSRQSQDFYLSAIDSLRNNEWEFFGYARGKVTIPDNCDLCLSISPDSAVIDKLTLHVSRQEIQQIIRQHVKQLYEALDNLGVNDIQGIYLYRNTDDDDLRHVGRLTGLKELFLKRTNNTATNAGVKHLEQLANLELLDLSKSCITDNALVSIAKLKSLKWLNLTRTSITGQGLAELHNLQINELFLRCLSLSKEGYRHLGNMQSLQRLHLGDNVEDTDLAEIKKLSGLRRLSLGSSLVTDAGVKHISELSKLNELHLVCESVTDAGVKDLCALQELRSISLYKTGITDKSAAYLARMAKLTTIHLSYTSVTSRAIADLSQLPNLKKLNLNNTKVNDSAGPYLAEMHGLEELSIIPEDVRRMPIGQVNPADYTSENAVTDKGYACLKTMYSLRVLHLGAAPITDKALEYLRDHPNLEVLWAYYTPITDAGIEALSTCTNLKELNIYETLITDKGMQFVASMHNLHVLNLMNTAITDEGLKHLVHLENLEEMNINGIKLDDEGLGAIARIPNLKDVDFDWNDFSKESLYQLIASPSLRSISIWNVPDDRSLFRKLQEAMPWCQIMPWLAEC